MIPAKSCRGFLFGCTFSRHFASHAVNPYLFWLQNIYIWFEVLGGFVKAAADGSWEALAGRWVIIIPAKHRPVLSQTNAALTKVAFMLHHFKPNRLRELPAVEKPHSLFVKINLIWNDPMSTCALKPLMPTIICSCKSMFYICFPVMYCDVLDELV